MTHPKHTTPRVLASGHLLRHAPREGRRMGVIHSRAPGGVWAATSSQTAGEKEDGRQAAARRRPRAEAAGCAIITHWYKFLADYERLQLIERGCKGKGT